MQYIVPRAAPRLFDRRTMTITTLSPAARKLIERQMREEGAFRERLIAAYGSAACYLGSLGLLNIDEPKSHFLPGFYALYEKTFPLAEEREPIKGFDAVLAFNKDAAVQSGFGPLYEAIAIARERGTGKTIAAANYVIMSYPAGQHAGLDFDASCHLNFVCVDAEVRGAGLARSLLDYVDRRVVEVVFRETGVKAPRVFLTCEQNNPDRMTREQIETDAAAALIDPLERTRWWSRRGYGRLDFQYEQPPLSPERASCKYIDFFVRIPGTGEFQSFPAQPLLEHLRRFFFVSVGKFAAGMSQNEVWVRQRKLLEAREQVPVLWTAG